MSAIVIIQQSDAIHFITDGAQYDPDAVIASLNSKVATLPHSHCAIAFRGASWPKSVLSFALGFATSLDHIVDLLPNLINSMTAVFDHMHGVDAPREWRNFEVTIAGWSDRMERMVAGVASSYVPCDTGDFTGMSFMEGYQTGAALMVAQGQAFPAVDIQAVLGREITTQDDVDAIDPERDGLALHCAQRTQPGLYFERAAYLVGGFAEITTVRRDSVTQKILRRWPDVVGETIKPEGAPPIEIAQAALDAAQAWEDAVRTSALIGEAA